MPIVWHVIQLYAVQGFRRFLLATGYKGELIERFVAEARWPAGVQRRVRGHGPGNADGRQDQAAGGAARGGGALLRDLRRRRGRHRPRRAAEFHSRARRAGEHDRRAPRAAVRRDRARRRGRTRARVSARSPARSTGSTAASSACSGRSDLPEQTACSSASRSSAWPRRASCAPTATRASGSAWTPTRTRSR